MNEIEKAYWNGVKRAAEDIAVYRDPDDVEDYVRKNDKDELIASLLRGAGIGTGLGISSSIRNRENQDWKETLATILGTGLAGTAVGGLLSPLHIAMARSKNRKRLLGA